MLTLAPKNKTNNTLVSTILEKTKLSSGILIILYVVGVLGTLLAIHDDFLLLTPLNLLLSLGIVLWNHPQRNITLGIFLATCFFVGFSAELIGVQTGLIFGDYSYGPVLGWKLWETPLMIGVNWAMLGYCSGVVVNHWNLKLHWFGKAVFSSLLMVGLDVLIEPVAIQYDFWTWTTEVPPLQNYIGWFCVALPLLCLFHVKLRDTKNKVAVLLFILQVFFFGSLYFWGT